MKNILVATDLSESAYNAANYACDLAIELGAKIHLLYVVHIPQPLKILPIEIIITPGELKQDTKSELLRIAAKLKELRNKSPEIEVHVRNGHAVQEIEKLAEEFKIDLIVMGLHGTGKIIDKIIGSTVATFVAKSRFPVSVIPPQCLFRVPSKIAFASDGKDIRDDSNLSVLMEIVRKFNSEVEIVTIESPRDYGDREEIEERLEKHFKNYKHSYFFPEINDVSEGIQNFIHNQAANLLVMARKSMGFSKKFSAKKHTRKLLFHTEIALLCLHA